jgi:exopolyphosphatase/guanosine-5'-triphosphate,3'-diphosphate pyrophosphatase
MRVAAIDCGTNTILCLIAEQDGGEVRALEDRAEITRLGEGLQASGQLKPEAIARTLRVLRGYVERIRALGCAHVLGVGTEALRRAENGHLFLNEATALLGTVGGRFQVIDGEREAALAWRAVRGSFPAVEGTRTVLDIGGGSTELLVGADEIEEVVSMPIGSVRLTEAYLHHDPPTPDETRALIACIDEALAGRPRPRGQLVGVAGTVTTLAAISLGLTDYDGDRVHGFSLDRATVEALLTRLGAQPLADRRRTPGLDPRRADVIYAGALILARVMEKGGLDRLRVSDRGIRWGLAYEAFGR